jgi:hypothetical protein
LTTGGASIKSSRMLNSPASSSLGVTAIGMGLGIDFDDPPAPAAEGEWSDFARS